MYLGDATALNFVSCLSFSELTVNIHLVPLFFRKVKKGTLLIDSSTIDPSVSKEMAVAAEKMGAVYMDAPVSGGMNNIMPHVV